MARRRQPGPGQLVEGCFGHAGMGGGGHLEQAFLAQRVHGLQVVFQIGLEGLALHQGGIVPGQRHQPVAAEEELHLLGLLAP